MIFKRVAKGSFPMFGSGRTLYHPLYIDNFIDACLRAMEEGRGDGQVYLIADEEYVEIEELVRKVGRALSVDVKIRHYPIAPLVLAGHVSEAVCRPFHIKSPIFPRRVDWYRQNRAFSIEKAKRELGYRPSVSLDEGLRRTAEWYKREGYLT
jgi:nucleoside-diphosphate-sugar epimerase